MVRGLCYPLLARSQISIYLELPNLYELSVPQEHGVDIAIDRSYSAY